MKFDFKNSELKKIFGEKKIQTISAHFKEVKIRSAIKLTYEIFKLLNLLDEFYEYGNLLGVFKNCNSIHQLNKDLIVLIL